MNPLSIILAIHLLIGLFMGLYGLKLIKTGFSSYKEFLMVFRDELGDNIYLRLIPTPFSFVALFTLLGVIGLIAWFVKD